MVSQLGAIAAGQVDRPTYITVLLIGPTNTMDQVGGENQNLMQGYSWPDKAELKISANPKVSVVLPADFFASHGLPWPPV